MCWCCPNAADALVLDKALGGPGDVQTARRTKVSVGCGRPCEEVLASEWAAAGAGGDGPLQPTLPGNASSLTCLNRGLNDKKMSPLQPLWKTVCRILKKQTNN